MATEQTQRQPETRPSEVRSDALLDRVAELEGMLSVCQDVINSLAEDALGYANDGDHEWPNRDELLSNIDRVLSNTNLHRTKMAGDNVEDSL